jgi:hypothetical protein
MPSGWVQVDLLTMKIKVKCAKSCVADPDRFGPDPDLTSENRPDSSK